MRHNTFHEIFQQVSDAPIKADKIAILKKHESAALKALLAYTYDPRIDWMLPKGAPPYTPLDERLDQQTRLAQQIRKLYLFTAGPGPLNETQKNLKPIRREQLFVQILEGVDPNDAKVLLMMKDRKLLYKGLTRNLVAETFPDVVEGWPE